MALAQSDSKKLFRSRQLWTIGYIRTCLACIVASPRLLESRVRTIEQMRLINALCRFGEMAAEQSGVHDSAR